MPDFQLPLSGDVIQTINPWNWYIKSFAPQLGVVNINLGRSSDPVIEKQILDEVGSYGRQLGQIGDALEVLLNRLNVQDLNDDEQRAISDFRLQLQQIERVKQNRRRAVAQASGLLQSSSDAAAA